MNLRHLYISIIFSFLLISCRKNNIAYKVSEDISKKHIYKELISDHHFELSRKALINSGKFNFINYRNDTLFILEMVDGESNLILAKCFNNKEVVAYSFERKQISINGHNYFSSRLEGLVKANDITGIKRQEGFPINIHPKPRVYASRIVFSNKGYHISTYTFNYFE